MNFRDRSILYNHKENTIYERLCTSSKNKLFQSSSNEDDEVKVFERCNNNGETLVGFGCTDDFGYSPDGDSEEDDWCCSMEPFFQELQKILQDGEAVIYINYHAHYTVMDGGLLREADSLGWKPHVTGQPG